MSVIVLAHGSSGQRRRIGIESECRVWYHVRWVFKVAESGQSSHITRHHYKEVDFVVHDVPMSAGTIFVMSGDRVLMDYFSCLGPIDPQLEREGRFVPVLAYLKQFERLKALSAKNNLTTADMVLLNKGDLIDDYSAFLHDLMRREGLSSFVHSRGYI